MFPRWNKPPTLVVVFSVLHPWGVREHVFVPLEQEIVGIGRTAEVTARHLLMIPLADSRWCWDVASRQTPHGTGRRRCHVEYRIELVTCDPLGDNTAAHHNFTTTKARTFFNRNWLRLRVSKRVQQDGLTISTGPHQACFPVRRDPLPPVSYPHQDTRFPGNCLPRNSYSTARVRERLSAWWNIMTCDELVNHSWRSLWGLLQ